MEAERTTIPEPARWSARVSVGSTGGDESLMDMEGCSRSRYANIARQSDVFCYGNTPI
jgi:hypothetical protein